MTALLLACICAALVILSSPYVADIVALVQAAAGASYRATISGLLVVAIAAFLAYAASRIRERRLVRYGALGGAVVLAALYTGAFGTGNADTDIVEAFHFVEYGGLAVLFHRAWRHHADARRLMFPLLAGLSAGFVDEWVQWYVPGRVGELHDVLLNLAAVGIGLLVAFTLDPPPVTVLLVHGPAARGVTAFAAGVLVLGAVFLYSVHGGYEIRDAGIGTFRSQYDSLTLRLLAADRVRAWRDGPPTYRSRFAREDHYYSEGLWHVQERNEAMAAADPFTAWRENLILERFFTPLLESPALSARYRWPPEQRATVEAQAASSAAAPYVSAAQPLPIYTWVGRALGP